MESKQLGVDILSTPSFVSIHKTFILHLCNFYKNLLLFPYRWSILNLTCKKGGSCLIYESDYRIGDVDDMIFAGTTVIPSER